MRKILDMLLRRADRLQGKLAPAELTTTTQTKPPPSSAAAIAQADALIKQGHALEDQGRNAEALPQYQQALALAPDYWRALMNLGCALHQAGELEPAVDALRQAGQQAADQFAVWYNLGNVLADVGRTGEAMEMYRRASRLNPQFADAYLALGNVLDQLGRTNEAIAEVRKALALQPQHVGACYNLAEMLRQVGQTEEALTVLQQARRIDPQHCPSINLYGTLQKDMGLLAEAERAYAESLAINPQQSGVYSNYLLTLNYDPTQSLDTVFAAHRGFGERFADPLQATWQPHTNPPDPQRRLRLGYISGDFRNHAVAYFFEPMLDLHQREQFEVYCYATGPRRDEITQRFQSKADQWRDVAALDDAALAAQIRDDGIDILIDLSGHTAFNRLLALARKPAPLQIGGLLGYPNTSGMRAMDYRLTNPYNEPPGMTEAYNVEKLLRLPDTSFCFVPCASQPQRRSSAELAVQPPPSQRLGHITFGSCNNLAKLTPEVIATWSHILQAVPASRLLLEIPLLDPALAARLSADFAQHDIAADRLLLLPRDSRQQYLTYHQIDIALDPFPGNGGTTSCDALWMGVPLISLIGRSFYARMGVVLLQHVGLESLLAEDLAAYIAKAVALAQDPARLTALRSSLRPRLEDSPLMDGPRFVRNLETAYRQVWQDWCRQH